MYGDITSVVDNYGQTTWFWTSQKWKNLWESPGKHWAGWLESVHKGLLCMARLTCYQQGQADIVQPVAKAWIWPWNIVNQAGLGTSPSPGWHCANGDWTSAQGAWSVSLDRAGILAHPQVPLGWLKLLADKIICWPYLHSHPRRLWVFFAFFSLSSSLCMFAPVPTCRR